MYTFAIIAIALHGSNIYLFLLFICVLLARSRAVLKVSHKRDEPPSEAEIDEF
jgi:hypothetical protein